jgi:regulator of RNase E activity RraA
VAVLSGDSVLADRDGIVIIPTTIAADVVEQTEEVLCTENLVRKEILQGVDPVAAHLRDGKF